MTCERQSLSQLLVRPSPNTTEHSTLYELAIDRDVPSKTAAGSRDPGPHPEEPPKVAASGRRSRSKVKASKDKSKDVAKPPIAGEESVAGEDALDADAEPPLPPPKHPPAIPADSGAEAGDITSERQKKLINEASSNR